MLSLILFNLVGHWGTCKMIYIWCTYILFYSILVKYRNPPTFILLSIFTSIYSVYKLYVYYMYRFIRYYTHYTHPMVPGEKRGRSHRLKNSQNSKKCLAAFPYIFQTKFHTLIAIGALYSVDKNIHFAKRTE